MIQAPHLDLVELPDRASWRAWLEADHAGSPGVWLAIGKKGRTRTALTYEDAVQEALCFGWIDSTTQRMDADRYKQLFTPRKPSSTWSKSNKARVERLVANGLMRPAGLAAVEAAKANGSWNLLDDVEDLVVPADLAAALEADPDAARHFAAFPDSARKMALYWVSSARRPETRAKRIAHVVSLAAAGRRLV
jgi:uncharacterized protein YdeI (YjbR/CyaY-like superfamily)